MTKFEELRAYSDGIRQGEITAAQHAVKRLADEMPALVKKEASATPTPTSMQDAQAKLAPLMIEAQRVCDRAIADAHQRHHDRLQAAAAHCGISTDAPGNPGVEHAQAFIATHAPPKK